MSVAWPKPTDDDRPRMIYVSGPPASGKTTLALHLADLLDLPLVSIDALRNGIAGRDGAAAFRAFYELLAFHVDKQISFIVDQALQAELAPAALRPLMYKAELVIIHCRAGREQCRDRLAARLESDSHRASRHTASAIAEMDDGSFNWAVYEMIPIEAPSMIVDTDDGYSPTVEEVAAFALHATS